MPNCAALPLLDCQSLHSLSSLSAFSGSPCSPLPLPFAYNLVQAILTNTYITHDTTEFPPVGHSLNQGSDLSMSGQTHETYPRCPAEERRVRGQPWFCCPQEGGGQGGILQSGRQLVCVSQWQLEQSPHPQPVACPRPPVIQ